MHFSSDKTSEFIRSGCKQQCGKQVFEAAGFYSGDKVLQDMAQEIRALNSADEASRVYYNAKRIADTAAEKAAYASDARAYKKARQTCAGDSNCKYITYKRGK